MQKIKKIGILTGGGDVASLNAVIAAVIQQCNRRSIELVGYIKGWEGLLNGNKVSLNNLELDPSIGGTVLKSSRLNLMQVESGTEKILKRLLQDCVDGLIVIGGEDTLSNAFYVRDFPKVLISKTIDNDVGLYANGLFVNHFTLGYPTAAEKITSFVSLGKGLRTTAYSHERIIIVESMGMHAGWLALSASHGNPDFIIIPEFPVHFTDFSAKVIRRFAEQGHAIIVISEGARWNDGSWISADENERDPFGHPRFRGAAEKLAARLKETMGSHFDTRNINAVNPSYLYRSGNPSEIDRCMARQYGEAAVEHFLYSSDTVLLYNEPGAGGVFNVMKYDFNSLAGIASLHRFVSQDLYDKDNYTATPEFVRYLETFLAVMPLHSYSIHL